MRNPYSEAAIRFTSYHVMSCHIISYHIVSYHIISYHIISYHIIWYSGPMGMLLKSLYTAARTFTSRMHPLTSGTYYTILFYAPLLLFSFYTILLSFSSIHLPTTSTTTTTFSPANLLSHPSPLLSVLVTCFFLLHVYQFIEFPSQNFLRSSFRLYSPSFHSSQFIPFLVFLFYFSSTVSFSK